MEMEISPLSLDLHEFATFPCYVDVLYELARLALPEGWRFRGRQAPEVGYANVEILAQYLEGVYRRHAASCNATEDEQEQDGHLLLRSGYACFHTGLFSRKGNQAIYALFLCDPAATKPPWWYFNRFILDGDDWFDWTEMLPHYPAIHYLPHEESFQPDWQVIIRFNTLLENHALLDRIPAKLHEPTAFRLHMQRLISSSKTMVRNRPTHMAQVLYGDTLQYALPLFLSDDDTECALVLKPDQRRVYIGHEVIPVREAYHRARQLGPVQAYWLTKLARGVDETLRLWMPAKEKTVAKGIGMNA